MAESPRYYCLAERPLITEPDGFQYWGLPKGAIGAVDLAPVGGHSHVFATSNAPFNAEDVAAKIGDGTPLDEYKPTSTERDAWLTLLNAGGASLAWTPGWSLLDGLWQLLFGGMADPDGELICKPGMPTHKGVLELHLGGHSLVRSERMPRDPTTHPNWPAIQRVLQNDYRKIREAARDRGAETHRKWLGAQRLKYGLTPEAARDLIGDVRDGLPRDPETMITESFNQPDSTTLGPDLTWTETSGDLETSSNRVGEVGRNGFGEARAESDLSSDDHYAKIEIHGTLSDSGDSTRALARFHSSARTHYGATAEGGGGGTVALFRRNNGSFTSLGDNLQSFATDGSDVIECEADGSTIKSILSGGTIRSVTDTNITANVRCGFVTQSGAEADNFEAADLVAGGGGGFPFRRYYQGAGVM